MFRVQIWYYPSEGVVSGLATFRISFKLAIVSYDYDVAVAYARQGEKQAQENSGTEAQSVQLVGAPRAAAPAVIGQSDAGIDRGQLPHGRSPVLSKGPGNHSSESTVDQGFDLGQCLLHDEVWQEYWKAFEEEFHECR